MSQQQIKGQRVRVLIVDDSATARVALRGALGCDPSIEIVGEVQRAESVLAMVERLRPDLVTMDLYLGAHSGVDVAREIMQSLPTPIIMVTGGDPRHPTLVYDALRAGVMEVAGKPPSPHHADYEHSRQALARTVRTLARVPVIARRSARYPGARESTDTSAPKWSRPSALPSRHRVRSDATRRPTPRLMVLGASTGGPPVLCQILRGVPRGTAVPIVLVQHLATGFTDGFARWMEAQTGLSAVVVRERTRLEGGRIHIAGEERHLQVTSQMYVEPDEGPAVNFHRPAIDVLFRSAARHFAGDVLAVLCTGLGADGAEGMRALFDAGARTIAQSLESCAVASMPRRALQLGAVKRCLAPEEIAAELRSLA
ncbi:MAG TPA: chemotaxis protein CheB [Polyangiaceae bacterium]